MAINEVYFWNLSRAPVSASLVLDVQHHYQILFLDDRDLCQ